MWKHESTGSGAMSVDSGVSANNRKVPVLPSQTSPQFMSLSITDTVSCQVSELSQIQAKITADLKVNR